jgi:DNA-binding MarR family transcriptional regulator
MNRNSIRSSTRLQNLLSLTPGNLITHLRKLAEAGYVSSAKAKGEDGIRTAVHLTHVGRAAFERYSAVLRQLLEPGPRQ